MHFYGQKCMNLLDRRKVNATVATIYFIPPLLTQVHASFFI